MWNKLVSVYPCGKELLCPFICLGFTVGILLKNKFDENYYYVTFTFPVAVILYIQYLRFQIEEGEIYAMINQKDGMVVFLDSPEKYASPETLCVLEQQMAACTKLHQYIQEMDEQIQVNPQVELLNSLDYTAFKHFY